jgi:curved DNA-binding protein CbpA
VVVDGVFQGRPFPDLPEEGPIERFPVAQLLAAIRYGQTTGMLDTTDQGTHRRIYIIEGNPTFMQSNAEGENVGALLLRRGRITEPDFDRCLRYMKEKSRTLQQSLLELRLVSEHDLATAYKLLAGQLLPLALGMAGGTFRWRETDAFIGRVPEGKFDTMAMVFDGIKRHVHPPQILAFFKGREDLPLLCTTEFERLMPHFRRAFSASNVAGQIDGMESYRTLTRARAKDASAVVPQLFALVASGMCVLREDQGDGAVEMAVHAAASQAQMLDDDDSLELSLDGDDDDREPSPDDRRARQLIERFHGEIMAQDFFAIFGTSRDAPDDKVKSAYFELAKKWHSDAFAGLSLGPSKRKLDDIFARITEGYETITNKAKREEYLVYLDRKAKGLPTDVNEIFRAEQLYDQAQAMIRRRDWPGARSVLEEAVRLNPDPLYFAGLGWAIFNADPKSPAAYSEGTQHLRRAIQEQENLPIAYQYLGQIAFNRSQPADAKKWWNRCLALEPNNIEAARGLRMLSQRSGEGSSKEAPAPKSGILGKLLKK